MKERRRTFPWVLMALGAALALCALVMLLDTRNMLQYCVLAPDPGEKGESLRKLSEDAKKLGANLKETLEWVTVGGDAGTVTLSTDGASQEAALFAMGEGWLEVNPRFLAEGRLIGESELASGAKVILLDEALAFRLFGNELPGDAVVKLKDASYRVVGKVRHALSLFGGQGVGDRQSYDAYVPLLAVAQNGVELDTLTLSAIPRGGSGSARIFEEAARNQWLDGGQLIDLKKEALRRMILPRMVLLVVGLYAMIGLFGRMTRLAGGWFAGFREALRSNYIKALVWRLAGIVALTLLGYAALIGATWLLMSFSIQPLYVFTEWVPENIVEWSSITRVFWNLTQAAAEPVRIGSRELRVVEFWGGVLRWGVVTALLGAALRGRRAGRQRSAK